MSGTTMTAEQAKAKADADAKALADYDKARPDMLGSAVEWMADTVEAEGRRWNTLTEGDPIVARAYERIEADAVRRGIPVDDILITHADLLDGLRKVGLDRHKKRKADAAKAEADAAHPVPQPGTIAAPLAPRPVVNAGTVQPAGTVASQGTGTAMAGTRAV